MKMIVSDYDGTLKRFTGTPSIREKIDLKKDLKKIDEFISDGNKFVIATKRITSSILNEINKYGINYSYLIAHEGLVNFDMYGNLLYANYLEHNLIKYLRELNSKTNLIESIEYYNAYGNKISKDEYVLISVKIKDIKEMVKHLNELKQEMEDLYYSYDFKTNKIWIHNKTDKNLGLSHLLDNIPDNFQKKDIITIGDSNHDISMIKEYNGFCIMNSDLARYSLDIDKAVPNIRRLIKKVK